MNVASKTPVDRLLSVRPAAAFAAALILTLGTISYTASTASLGPVPIVLVAVPILLIAYAPHIISAIQQSKALQAFTAFWLIWCAITAARLLADFGSYGESATRDAVITVSFSGVFIGAALRISSTEATQRRTAKTMLLALAAYSGVYIIRQVAPGISTEFFSVQNVGVASIALIAGGLWYFSGPIRAVPLAAGFISLMLTQSRIMLVVGVMTLIAYLTISSRHAKTSLISRILILLLFGAVGLVALSVLNSSGLVSGRIGSLSFDSAFQLVNSLFDDNSALAGSRRDRERWWADALGLLFASPTTFLTGVGLGPDLAGGFAIDGVLIRKPHNDFLETAARFGGPIGIAFASFYIAACIRSAQRAKHDSMFFVITAWLVAAGAYALAQPYFSYPHGAVLAGILIGMAFSNPTGITPTAATTTARQFA